MAKRKRRPEKFSVTKAVKANARERVGQPKPGRVITEQPATNPRKRKHKETFEQLLNQE
jgi:hypothetical protein